MLFPIQLLLFLLLQQWVLSGFSLRASISLKKLGNNLTTHFPLGAYVPVEFNLLVDDTIKLHEQNGLLGVAVRSCIVYPQYHCANWLPVMTSGRSAITKRTSSNPASNPASKPAQHSQWKHTSRIVHDSCVHFSWCTMKQRKDNLLEPEIPPLSSSPSSLSFLSLLSLALLLSLLFSLSTMNLSLAQNNIDGLTTIKQK